MLEQLTEFRAVVIALMVSSTVVMSPKRTADFKAELSVRCKSEIFDKVGSTTTTCGKELEQLNESYTLTKHVIEKLFD
jgi:hypothetical protein